MAENTETPKDDPLFYQIVLTFHAAAWQQLGKTANPFTNKSEVDLQAASLSINMIDSIKNKTRGNLSPQEQKFLEQALSDLKINYMEELKKQEKSASEPEPTAEEKEEKTAGGDEEEKEKE